MVGRAGSVSSSTSKVKKGTGATIPTGSGFFALSWYPKNSGIFVAEFSGIPGDFAEFSSRGREDFDSPPG